MERAEGVLSTGLEASQALAEATPHPNYIGDHSPFSHSGSYSQFSNLLRHSGCSQRRFWEHRKIQEGGTQKSIAVNYKKEIERKEAKEQRVKVQKRWF